MNVIRFLVGCVEKCFEVLDFEAFEGISYAAIVFGGFVLMVFINHFWKGARA